jgi:hypothetical protein
MSFAPYIPLIIPIGVFSSEVARLMRLEDELAYIQATAAVALCSVMDNVSASLTAHVYSGNSISCIERK